MIKKNLVLLVIVLALTTSISFGQTPVETPNAAVETNQKGKKEKKNKKDDGSQNDQIKTPETRAAKMTQRLTKQLDLDDATSQKVSALALARATQIDVINNSNDDKKAKSKALKANAEDFESKLKSVLSEGQFAKYQEIKEAGRNRRNDEGKDRKGKGKDKKEDKDENDKDDN